MHFDKANVCRFAMLALALCFCMAALTGSRAFKSCSDSSGRVVSPYDRAGTGPHTPYAAGFLQRGTESVGSNRRTPDFLPLLDAAGDSMPSAVHASISGADVERHVAETAASSTALAPEASNCSLYRALYETPGWRYRVS